MNQYFFGLSKAEKQNILDQHKSIYDGYVTEYAQQSNLTPLYVQDFANDKGGITVSNKGNVTTYKNVGINEARLDTIGDGPMDLKNGTVDLDSIEDTTNTDHEMKHDLYPSPNEDEVEIISLGSMRDDEEHDDNEAIFHYGISDDEDDDPEVYEFDIDEIDNFLSGPMNESFEEIDEDIRDDFKQTIYESLDMFERFKKYN